jgi:beta-glucanase (GH16 family)
MKTLVAALAAVVALSSCASLKPAPPEDWMLMWSDEFDQDGPPNPQNWLLERWRPGHTNEELQEYVSSPETASVKDGVLRIRAIRTDDGYQSARLTTESKFSFLYGRVEFRAKLPRGRGTWPALWLMPDNLNAYGRGWPDSGEIDVMEHVGFDPGVIHASAHTGAYNWPAGTQKTATMRVSDPFDQWHIYGLEWSPAGLIYTVDGSVVLTFRNEGTGWKAWPFDQKFHIIMNLAIGGNWGGQKGVDDSAFPAEMDVNWVRVYQKRP